MSRRLHGSFHSCEWSLILILNLEAVYDVELAATATSATTAIAVAFSIDRLDRIFEFFGGLYLGEALSSSVNSWMNRIYCTFLLG